MACSEARRLANQRNAQKSTGPKTEAGKKIASLNALDHGLCGESGFVPAHLVNPIARHTASFRAAYRPAEGPETWFIDQAANAAARLDHCQFMLRAEIDDQIQRAELCWDEDRELAVAELAARLPKDPARIVHHLGSSLHGCRWLIARWEELGRVLDEQHGWTEGQINQAFLLLGVAEDQRGFHSYLTMDANPGDLSDLVREQLDRLQSQHDNALVHLDAYDRELTELGLPVRPSAETLRLQRYESRLRRVLNESIKEFRRLRAEGPTVIEPNPLMEPYPETAPMVTTPPEPRPAAPEREPLASARLADLIARTTLDIQAPAPFPTIPTRPAVSPTPSVPQNRKARRALEKAARKARAHAR